MTGGLLWLGMKPVEVVTIWAVVTGPILAVALSLWMEERRRDRDQRIQVVRMMLNTRRMPSDAAYSVAINLVPVEFRKYKNVLDAWRAYIEAVRYQPTEENRGAHDKRVTAKQISLLFNMMKSLKIEVSEADLEADGYVAQGFIWRDNLYLDSLTATRETANALRRQNELTQVLVEAATRVQVPTPVKTRGRAT